MGDFSPRFWFCASGMVQNRLQEKMKEHVKNLTENIARAFNLEELKTIVFFLNLDWDELPGQEKSRKTQALIIRLMQRGRLSELIARLRNERPHINWLDAPPPDQQRSFAKTINLAPYSARYAMIETVGSMNAIGEEWALYASGSPGGPPQEYRRVIEADDDEIVSRQYGQEVERITAAEFETKLDQEDLEYIYTLEDSMKNHYQLWRQYYPQRMHLSGPDQEKEVKDKLNKLVQGIAQDLAGILDFLKLLGFDLDDHYLHYRSLARDITARGP